MEPQRTRKRHSLSSCPAYGPPGSIWVFTNNSIYLSLIIPKASSVNKWYIVRYAPAFKINGCITYNNNIQESSHKIVIVMNWILRSQYLCNGRLLLSEDSPCSLPSQSGTQDHMLFFLRLPQPSGMAFCELWRGWNEREKPHSVGRMLPTSFGLPKTVFLKFEYSFPCCLHYRIAFLLLWLIRVWLNCLGF